MYLCYKRLSPYNIKWDIPNPQQACVRALNVLLASSRCCSSSAHLPPPLLLTVSRTMAGTTGGSKHKNKVGGQRRESGSSRMRTLTPSPPPLAHRERRVCVQSLFVTLSLLTAWQVTSCPTSLLDGQRASPRRPTWCTQPSTPRGRPRLGRSTKTCQAWASSTARCGEREQQP